MRKTESHSFGARLKELRKSRNLTQEELANELNKKYMLNESKPTISQFENNKRVPDFDRIVNIADYFNVSIDYLACREKVNDNHSDTIPTTFSTPQEAIEFIIKQPMVANFGGYDLDKMSDQEIMDMAEDVADMLRIMAKKHKK